VQSDAHVRTCPIKASGSSRQRLTCPACAIRGSCVDPRPRYKAPGGCPPHGSLTDIPLPSTGSPRYRFPCFNGTMKMCDSRCPSHRASFPSLGDTRRRACRFAPGGPERMTAGLEYVIRSPTPENNAWRRYGPPKVPGEPLCAYALLSDPGEPDRTANKAIAVRSARPHAQRTARALHER